MQLVGGLVLGLGDAALDGVGDANLCIITCSPRTTSPTTSAVNRMKSAWLNSGSLSLTNIGMICSRWPFEKLVESVLASIKTREAICRGLVQGAALVSGRYDKSQVATS